MLFDLRGHGRRRTVQIIYFGLALIFLLGAVGFGIGGGLGGGGGGIFNALEGKGGGGSGVDYSGQIKKARKLTEQQPGNPKAWASLLEVTLRQAGTGEYFSSTEGFTAKAKPLLIQAGEAWQRYLQVNPNPSTDLANEMYQLYADEEALNNPQNAMQALQIIIASRPPSAALYANLATLAYKLHNTHEGDLASKKAIALAPVAERTVLENELARAKLGETGKGALPKTFTTTTNGKKVVLKSNGHGGYTSTPVGPASTGTATTGSTTSSAPGGLAGAPVNTTSTSPAPSTGTTKKK
jgi:tetratricopeptide (TPR) repeat protein